MQKNIKNIFFKSFLAWVFSLAGVAVSAQNLSGNVVIDFSNTTADGIKILNQTKKLYTTTDMTGHFTISASVKDTIIFSGSFLETRKFIVTQTALSNPNFTIHLNTENIKLADLVVRPKLTGFIEKDIATVPNDKRKENLYKSLGIDIRVLDMKYEENKEPILKNITTLDVISLFKHLNGYYRKLESLQTYEKYIKKINEVREFIGDDFFINYLKLPKDEIQQFVIFTQYRNQAAYEQAFKTKSYLAMSSLLKKELPLYLKRIEERDKQNPNNAKIQKD
ncbi:carboxypeptidase-like regulatory domain-containing protein [Ornithobacterium rhinotracheale]|uniref:carboxypeptidase-like regulatory domain-containing protein n=1 Tax=Ornithobacterium rhinotracheale TaxID=28251 RepID=UPI002158A50D|nr:carboxypeptidase-like regulatory domain-containing protein [Ornithobacterium rhinotracheale]UVD86325.1 carboxypeptidase-like regulatory domain-containing protein [Ornithobacterium rhinotracheale]